MENSWHWHCSPLLCPSPPTKFSGGSDLRCRGTISFGVMFSVYRAALHGVYCVHPLLSSCFFVMFVIAQLRIAKSLQATGNFTRLLKLDGNTDRSPSVQHPTPQVPWILIAFSHDGISYSQHAGTPGTTQRCRPTNRICRYIWIVWCRQQVTITTLLQHLYEPSEKGQLEADQPCKEWWSREAILPGQYRLQQLSVRGSVSGTAVSTECQQARSNALSKDRNSCGSDDAHTCLSLQWHCGGGASLNSPQAVDQGCIVIAVRSELMCGDTGASLEVNRIIKVTLALMKVWCDTTSVSTWTEVGITWRWSAECFLQYTR